MFSFLSKRKQSEDPPTVRLMKTMHFGGKDLDLNRDGLLSDLQKRRLNRDFFERTVMASLVSVVMVGMSWEANRHYPFGEYGSPFVAILSIFAVVGIVSFSYAVYRHLENIACGTVLAFTGRAKKHATGNHSIMFINYEKRVERIYRVRVDQYGAFLEGETYTVYSTSFNQHLVLSAEHMPDEQQSLEHQ